MINQQLIINIAYFIIGILLFYDFFLRIKQSKTTDILNRIEKILIEKLK